MVTWGAVRAGGSGNRKCWQADTLSVRRAPRVSGNGAEGQWPRIHPICPAIASGSLLAFIGPSHKRDDLLRDGRYAMHTFRGKAWTTSF